VKREVASRRHYEGKENSSSSNMGNIQMVKPKQTTVQRSLKDEKYRPKSATQQEIKKESIKHAKLGSNRDTKPQISYISKVAIIKARPQTAKPVEKKL
jgi:hypothetical protein